jgi:hypothetical protein
MWLHFVAGAIPIVTPKSFTVLLLLQGSLYYTFIRFYYVAVCREALMIKYIGVRLLRFAVTQVFSSACLVCCLGQV